ncbi:MAG: DNRLRE domain-containing protein, partial [Clostridia bacterium]|nr:DNRLRE domain-containing protein [Clostridia bacterium]
TTKNEVSVNFSSSPSNGITMGYGEHTVTLKPIFTTKGVTASKKDNAVEYVELFDSNTTLKYTPLLSGIKEDIVLTKYTGVNEYSFTLTTNGLGIYESENGYFLAESKATKAIFYLGDVIAYDANYVPYEGTLTVKTIKENQEYTLIVSVDEEFLTDENTVYPVTIDPTITISDTASGAGAIQDAPIFSARPSSNHGTYEYDRVGTPSADFGIGRTVVRLYGLINSSVYKNLSANQITSVIFYAKEATGSATQYINLYPLTNTSWTESGVTWNNVGSRVTSVNYGANMAYAQLTPFTITNLVKGWKNGTYAANAGFIMMSSNESANKCFVSSEHTDTSRRPYVAMSYNLPIDFDNATTLTLDAVKTVTITESGEKKCYKFTPTETGFYTLQSISSSGDPQGWLYNHLEENLTSNDDLSDDDLNFRITYHLISGKTYYFPVGLIGNGTGTFRIQLWKSMNSSYLKPTTITFSSCPEVNNISLQSHIYKFTPDVSGTYVFYSSGSSDAKAWLYDSGLSYLTENDDGAGNRNFRLEYELTANNTYYIVAGHYGTVSGSYEFSCLRAVTLENDIYRINNVVSDMYVDIEIGGTSEWVKQDVLDNDASQKWSIQRQSDGYYTIRSEYGNRYYLGITSNSVSTNNIKVSQSVSDNTKWRIFENSRGKCYFEAKAALGKLLNAPSGEDSLLQLRYLGDTNLTSSQWDFRTKTIMLYSVYAEGHNHLEQVEDIKFYVESRYPYAAVIKNEYLTPFWCIYDLKNCDVFISRSHGNYSPEKEEGEIPQPDEVDSTFIALDDGILYSHSFVNMSSQHDYLKPTDDYSGLGIALFVACWTGVGENNLPSAIVEYGAEAAVGFTRTIDCNVAGDWTYAFMTAFLEGQTAKEAYVYARLQTGLTTGVFYGNEDYVFEN